MKKKQLILLTSISIVFLLITVIFLFKKHNRQEKEIEKLTQQISARQYEDNLNTTIKTIYTHDNTFFAGQYELALTGYRTLLEDTLIIIDKQYLQHRVNTITDILKRKESPISSTDDRVVLVLDTNNNSHFNMDTTYSKLTQEKISKTDSLEHKIKELNRKIISRERALEQKEQLKATVIKSIDGSNIQYIGDTRDGKAHGNGTGLWESSGSTYKGDWINNMRHGYGIYTWKDGVRYEGDFRNDKREGKGTYFWPSGERYVGNWKNNLRNGEGTLYDKDGNISYKGQWENDKPKK